MNWRDDSERFGWVTKTLHWSIALGIVTQFLLMWYRDALPKGEDLRTMLMVVVHKPLGVSLLFLGILFVAWRMFNAPPRHPDHMPRWEHLSARALQWGLFAMMILMPLSGLLMSSYAGKAVVMAGHALPLWVDKNQSLASYFYQLHHQLSWVILGMLCLHVGAALKHAVIDRDHILRRMLPW